MPGSAPKPQELKILQGTFRKDRAKNEPNPTGSLGDPPEHMSDHAAQCWYEIADICADRVLTYADRIAVELASGLLLEYRINKDFSVMKLNMLITLLGKFGMTPSDRGKINLPGKPTKNAFSAL